MKKFKKVISLLMAVVMLTMLCACGGTSSSVVAGSTAGSGAASTSGSAADGKGERKVLLCRLCRTGDETAFFPDAGSSL